MKLVLLRLHWFGFFITAFMLSLSFLDPSQDELLLHFIASSLPLLITWAIRIFKIGPVPIFPFLK